MTMLQWSHVFSDMVRLISAEDEQFAKHLLQWSHVFSDMVRIIQTTEGGDGQWLQWSHVFSDMVRGSNPDQTSADDPGFNGAMSFQTW